MLSLEMFASVNGPIISENGDYRCRIMAPNVIKKQLFLVLVMKCMGGRGG